MTKLIIRTQNGAPLSARAEHQVIKLAGLDHAQIEYQSIEKQYDFLYNYKERITSANAAWQFMVKCLDKRYKSRINIQTLTHYLNHLNQLYLQKLASIKDSDNVKLYQAILVEYLQQLEFIFTQITGMPQHDFQEQFAKAEEYAALVKPRPVLATFTPSNIARTKQPKKMGLLLQMEVPLQPIDKSMQREYLQALSRNRRERPDWFNLLPRYERAMFREAFKGATLDNIEEKIIALSSKHRTLPGVANYATHVKAFLDDDGRLVHHFPNRKRSSKFASRDVIKQSETIRDKHARHNLEKIIRDDIEQKLRAGELKERDIEFVPILIQTLITPIFGKSPDTEVYRDKLRVIEQLRTDGLDITLPNGKTKHYQLNIFDTNHPLNPGRYASPVIGRFKIGNTTLYNGSHSAKQAYNLASFAKHYVTSDLTKNILIQKTARALEELLNQSALLSYRADNNRELFISSLEQLLVAQMHGLAYGSCISGKDRKGLEIIHTDAMEIYYRRYGELPYYNDTGEKRQNFIAIFVELYASYHQHMNAGQNAFGANAIKTPYLYLPKDIQVAIKSYFATHHLCHSKNVLKDSDVLASNNEFNKIIAKAPPLTEAQQQTYLDKYRTFKQGFHPHEADTSKIMSGLMQAHDAEEEHYRSKRIEKYHETLDKHAANKLVLQAIQTLIHDKTLDKKSKRKLVKSAPTGIKAMRSKLRQDDQVTTKTISAQATVLHEITKERLTKNNKHRDQEVHSIYNVIHQLTKDILEEKDIRDNPNLDKLSRLANQVSRSPRLVH